MQKTDWLIIFCFFALGMGYTTLVFRVGKAYEWRRMQPQIEEMATGLCKDCRDIGYQNCVNNYQDLLNKEDEENKR